MAGTAESFWQHSLQWSLDGEKEDVLKSDNNINMFTNLLYFFQTEFVQLVTARAQKLWFYKTQLFAILRSELRAGKVALILGKIYIIGTSFIINEVFFISILVKLTNANITTVPQLIDVHKEFICYVMVLKYLAEIKFV